uniref:Uncharacterized protein n=1 Tax=Anguilla anguilla TaxID=7936 RepID=A0A0E9SUI3_ANGAN
MVSFTGLYPGSTYTVSLYVLFKLSILKTMWPYFDTSFLPR